MTATTSHVTAPAAPAWQYALCAQTDPDLFFPEGPGGKTTRLLEQAKRICGRCPIRSACLEWALDTGQSFGVWGGLDETERRTLVRTRVDRSASYERCIAEQEYIEQRVAQDASYRVIAEELGVGKSAVGRAIQFFQAERAAAAVKEVQPA